jgi:uncharacterized protein (DUF1330 family)
VNRNPPTWLPALMPEGHGSLEAYGKAAHPLLEEHSGQELHHFEGEWNDGARLTMFRFPSRESLLAFRNSSEYQAIKHLRTDVIPPNFTIAVEGGDYPG